MVDGKWHGGVGAIDAGTAGVDQMLHTVVAATFKNVRKADDVAVDVSERVFDGVAHAGLGGEVHHALGLVISEGGFDGFPVGQINAQVGIVRVVRVACQPGFLDGRVIVVVGLSMPMTKSPRSSRRKAKFEPMNPAAPVTSTFIYESLPNRSRV